MPNFYHLTASTSAGPFAEWTDEVETEQLFCPLEPGHQRGGKRIDPLAVRVPSNLDDDIMWTWYSECLLRERPRRIFTHEGLTGFDLKPVKACAPGQRSYKKNLWELIVTGWAGIAPTASGIQLQQNCPGCGNLVYSSGEFKPDRLISKSAWDGSDFFMVWPLPKFIFVSERVADVIKAERLSGVKLVPVEEITLSGSLSPGRLSYWMPRDRAKELGLAARIF